MDIPQDIIDNVIAAVGDDTRSLKQCSLVSSSFLLPSRKRLFSRITLGSDRACQRIHQFLVQNTVIQSSVRAITLTGYIGTLVSYLENSECQWMNCSSLLAFLRLPFCCLERFSINVDPDGWNLKPWNWNNFSSELIDALSNTIIHSSNLKTLSLNGVTNMPVTFFLHTGTVHLTTLELHSVSPMDFCYEISSSLTSAASKGVVPTTSHLVIDRCIWQYSECHFEYASGPTISIFLPFMCCIRLLEIYVETMPTRTLGSSLCISLTSPATIEHLKFYVTFCDKNNDSDHDCFTSYEHLRDANVWSHLDSITTHPSGSRLQRVDINIYYCRALDSDWHFRDANEVLKAVLDGLPLLRKKDILFVEVNSKDFIARYGPGSIMGSADGHSIIIS